MKTLLHICCGPCSIYPLTYFFDNKIDVTGYFFNPNIHPYLEFKKRINSTLQVAEHFKINVDIDRNYGLVDYLRQVVFHEDNRCFFCYDMRIEQVAKTASLNHFDSFSTTLLYSRYQNHQLIRQRASYWADVYGVNFYYHDFRTGWQYGIDQSLKLAIYRQPYCGCIYSEQERYDNRLKKQLKKEKKKQFQQDDKNTCTCNNQSK